MLNGCVSKSTYMRKMEMIKSEHIIQLKRAEAILRSCFVDQALKTERLKLFNQVDKTGRLIPLRKEDFK